MERCTNGRSNASLTGALLSLALVLCAPFAGAVRVQGEAVSFPELELELELPALEGLAQGPPEEEGSSEVAAWSGTLNGKRFRLTLSRFSAEELSLYEPGDVARLAVEELRGAERFEVREESFPRGSYGFASYACLVVGDVSPAQGTDAARRHFLLCGLLEEQGYALHAEVEPLPDASDEALVRGFLASGVRFGGPARDPRWSADEVRERWLAWAPEELHADFVQALKKKSTAKEVCLRTDHYLVLTNASGGEPFARQLEENHERIRALFPFAPIEGERLMPVLMFRTRDEYLAFLARSTGSSAAEHLRGFAWKDSYASWYKGPDDPVILRQQTHQIFANRLRLRGGGAWFQGGVAAYAASSRNDRTVAARRVRDGTARSLRELVALESLSAVPNERHGGKSETTSLQAALLIEFLRESELGRERFEEFLRTLGTVQRGDVDGIDAGFRAVYGVGLDGVEEAWRAYCKKR